jgi:hypothetical protein
LGTHDCGPETNPAPFLNADCPALHRTLMSDRDGYILESMVVIGDKSKRAENSIPFDVNTVFCGNHTSSLELAAVFKNDDSFVAIGNFGDVDPNIAFKEYGISDADVRCDGSMQFTRAMYPSPFTN